MASRPILTKLDPGFFLGYFESKHITFDSHIYMEAALNHLRQQGMDLKEEDVARLSPLPYKHVNMLGHYSFSLADFITQGKLRSLNEQKICNIDA